MKIINCNCDQPDCITTAVVDHDYLIIREYRDNEHHIASIKLPPALAAYIRTQLCDPQITYSPDWHNQHPKEER